MNLKQKVKGGVLIEMLHQSIDDLFGMNDEDFIKTIQRIIPETHYLKENTYTTDTRIKDNSSNDFFGLAEKAQKQAFGSLLRFKEVVNGTDKDYKNFVACQEETKKTVLTLESFKKLHHYVHQTLKSPEDFAAAIWSIVCNDLGKAPALIEIYRTSEEPSAPWPISHNSLLANLLKNRHDLFPMFNALAKSHQQYIIDGFASDCDISKFEQLEYPFASIHILAKLNKTSLNILILQSIFDVAGAATHVKANGSLTMHEETWNFFNELRLCLEKLSDDYSTDDAYQEYLKYRGHCIGIENNSQEATALIRIAGFTRLATVKHGQHLTDVWNKLPQNIKRTLINELNIHGTEFQRAIFINYGSALLLNPQSAALKNLNERLKVQKHTIPQGGITLANTEGLKIGLWYLSDIFTHARTAIMQENQKNNDEVFVAECKEVAQTLSINLMPPSESTLVAAQNQGKIYYSLLPKAKVDEKISVITSSSTQQSSLSKSGFFKIGPDQELTQPRNILSKSSQN